MATPLNSYFAFPLSLAQLNLASAKLFWSAYLPKLGSNGPHFALNTANSTHHQNKLGPAETVHWPKLVHGGLKTYDNTHRIIGRLNLETIGKDAAVLIEIFDPRVNGEEHRYVEENLGQRETDGGKADVVQQ